jgi:phosphoribosyl 1,2-cyclic phosphate phosphodiesterase
LKVTFLGTGTSQGVPIIGCTCAVCTSKAKEDNRLRSSIFVETDTVNFIIDTGPDFRQQMLRMGPKRMDAVVFTHSHKDHISGFDDIRAFNFIQKAKMDVYLEDPVMLAIKRDFFYMFEEIKYPGIPEADFHIINNHPFKIKNLEITPIRVHHYRMPVLGFRVGNFTYITDANSISEAEIEKIRGSEVLVLNALRRETHISHFSFEEAIAMAVKIGAKQTYFTHISHQLGLHEDVNRELPAAIRLAYDGLELEL